MVVLKLNDAIRKAFENPAKRFGVFVTLNDFLGMFLRFLLLAAGATLGVFILFSLTFWASSSPERAFNFVAFFMETIEVRTQPARFQIIHPH